VHTYPALLAELADRGWSDADLEKLTWHNALRVLRDTEAAARAQRLTRGRRWPRSSHSTGAR
jgi:membrane dipeptidase